MKRMDDAMIDIDYDTTAFYEIHNRYLNEVLDIAGLDTNSSDAKDVRENSFSSAISFSNSIDTAYYNEYRSSLTSGITNPKQADLLKSLFDRIVWLKINNKESYIPNYLADYRDAVASESTFSSQTKKETNYIIAILEASEALWRSNLQ